MLLKHASYIAPSYYGGLANHWDPKPHNMHYYYYIRGLNRLNKKMLESLAHSCNMYHQINRNKHHNVL